MVTQDSVQQPSTRWLSMSTLEELTRLAEKSPKEFHVHYRRLDIRRKLQLRHYLFERHQVDGFSIPTILTGPVEAPPTEGPHAAELSPATTEASTALLDELAADEAAEIEEETPSAQEQGDDAEAAVESLIEAVEEQDHAAETALEELMDTTEAPADEKEATSLDQLTEEATQETLEAPATSEKEASSLDALFAEPAESESESVSLDDLFASESEGGGEAMSLDDLFGGGDNGSSSLDDLFGGGDEEAPAAVEVAEPEPEKDESGLPADYGVPMPVTISRQEIAEFLKPLPLFEGASEQGLSAIASMMNAVRYRAESLLCRKGDPGDEMWVIKEGNIHVMVRGKMVATIPTGAVVGEMAILDGSPRSADLVTGEETVLLSYTRSAYGQTFRLDYEAGLTLVRNIMKIQQDRMRTTTEGMVSNAVAAERAEGEIRRAKETQDLALPKGLPTFGDSEFFVSFNGARGPSGDYYDFIEVPGNPDQLIVIMGDSTGHGLNAGLEMLLAKSASFTQMNSEGTIEKITEAINNITTYIFGATMFMTFVIALLDRKEKTIRYVNAGQQSHPYLYRMKEDEFVPLKSQTFQLGIMQGATYESEVITYEDGDLLICYSDGIIEAPYCPAGATAPDRTKEFGDERLEAFIRAHKNDTPQKIVEDLLVEAEKFCRFYNGHEVFIIDGKEVEQDGDDITNIVIRLR